jgi:hypothetical protein
MSFRDLAEPSDLVGTNAHDFSGIRHAERPAAALFALLAFVAGAAGTVALATIGAAAVVEAFLSWAD